MHETGIVRDLLARAEAEEPNRRIEAMRLRVGALSGFTAESLGSAVDRMARHRWGYAPRVSIEMAGDLEMSDDGPGALGVVLVSLTVRD
jgi:Zn finger protein HypA/HybF involved in hydrogenase expression